MFRSPTAAGLPSLDLLLGDIATDPQRISKHLGLSHSTLKNYIRAGQAPRPVMLSLFWESRWGRSTADTEAANWAAVQYRRAQIAERQNAALLRQIAVLEGELATRGHGAANGPIFLVG